MPSPEFIRANFAEMANAQASVQRAQTTMDTEVADLRTRLEGLRNIWIGDAREAYGACMSQWDSAALKIEALIGELAAGLGFAIDTMGASEARAAGMFGR